MIVRAPLSTRVQRVLGGEAARDADAIGLHARGIAAAEPAHLAGVRRQHRAPGGGAQRRGIASEDRQRVGVEHDRQRASPPAASARVCAASSCVPMPGPMTTAVLPSVSSVRRSASKRMRPSSSGKRRGHRLAHAGGVHGIQRRRTDERHQTGAGATAAACRELRRAGVAERAGDDQHVAAVALVGLGLAPRHQAGGIARRQQRGARRHRGERRVARGRCRRPPGRRSGARRDAAPGRSWRSRRSRSPPPAPRRRGRGRCRRRGRTECRPPAPARRRC